MTRATIDEFVSSKGAERTRRVGVAVLLLGLLAVHASGDTRVPLPESDRAAPIAVPGADFDPDAGCAVPGETIFQVPTVLPDDWARGEMLGLRAACSCYPVNGPFESYQQDDAFRGNIYSIDPDGQSRTLCEFTMDFDVPASAVGTILCFHVYQCVENCDSATSDYERVEVAGWDNEVETVVSGPKTYSPGLIPGGVVFAPGEKFILGVAWDTGSSTVKVKYGRNTLPYPDSTPDFGTIEGSCARNDTSCDPGPLPDLARYVGGAYAQEICLEPGPGACCLGGSSCQVLTRAECNAQGGQFSEEKKECSDIACPLLKGACCFGNECGTYTRYDCEYFEGTFYSPSEGETSMFDFNTNGIIDAADHAEFVRCMEFSRGPAGFPEPQECEDVCDCGTNGMLDCDTSGLYFELGEECLLDCECTSNGDVWDLFCSNGPVFDPAPACKPIFDFNSNGTIDLADYTEFQAAFGVQPNDPCAGNPCVGVCCRFSGCDDNDGQGVEEGNCDTGGGETWHSGLRCGDPGEDCDLLGACCSFYGDCEETTDEDCVATDSNWCEGVRCDYQDCSFPFSGCEPIGACCAPEGGCTPDVSLEYCEDELGGIFLGEGTVCADCPIGACCAPEGGCTPDVLESYCLTMLGGTFLGVDTLCADCPIGACCKPSGDCEDDVPQAWCTNELGGDYQGDGTSCDTVTCPRQVACCFFHTGGCVDLEETTCEAAGGFSQGPGTTCAGVGCVFPDGACCFSIGLCVEMSSDECAAAGDCFTWPGEPCPADGQCHEDQTTNGWYEWYECNIGGLDCNTNGVADHSDILGATSEDCNGNAIPDECDLGVGTSADCNTNAVPDECDIGAETSADCNGNTVPDECELAAGTSADCNTNAVLDECDISGGTSLDENTNGIPDECEQSGTCPFIYDLDGSCFVDSGDLGLFAACWLLSEGEAGWDENSCADKDFDCSGTVDATDSGLFAGAWMKGHEEIDPTNYPACRYCEGTVVCP